MSAHEWCTALDQAGFVTMRYLLTAFWQSTILLVAAIGLSWLLVRRRAVVRRRIWLAALLAAPVLPLITAGAKRAGAPQAPLSVLPTYAPPAPVAGPSLETVRLPPGPVTITTPVPAPPRVSPDPPPATSDFIPGVPAMPRQHHQPAVHNPPNRPQDLPRPIQNPKSKISSAFPGPWDSWPTWSSWPASSG